MAICAAIAACGSAPPLSSDAPAAGGSERATASSRSVVPQSVFEQQRRDRALAFTRQRRLADAALEWEVLVALRPEVGEYRERLAETQRAIAAAVAEQLPRAAQTAQRGDIDAASQQYLAVLALQPDNAAAAEALRQLERERNKRNYLGKYSRITITKRSASEAEMAGDTPAQMSGRIDVEHAELLAGDGEYDEAIALLERRIASDRRDAAARRLLADVYARKAESLLPGDKPGAVAALQKSLRLDPNSPGVTTRLKQLKSRAAASTTASGTGTGVSASAAAAAPAKSAP